MSAIRSPRAAGNAAGAVPGATPRTPDAAATFDVLGVPVSAIDGDAAVASIERWIDERARRYVCITGVHGVVESRTDPELRRCFRQAGLVTPDGMPLVWVAWLRGLKGVRRVYGPDLMLKLSGADARPGTRHYYFGGAPGVADLLRRRMLERNPDLLVVGCSTPPFGPTTPRQDDDAVAAINAARPDILWVGLSTPKQDLWMLRHRERLDVPVVVGVGAAFDFLSGTKKQAPTWLRGSGFEWSFRLATEPRRLASRYGCIVPLFLPFLAREVGKAALVALKRCSVAV